MKPKTIPLAKPIKTPKIRPMKNALCGFIGNEFLLSKYLIKILFLTGK